MTDAKRDGGMMVCPNSDGCKKAKELGCQHNVPHKKEFLCGYDQVPECPPCVPVPAAPEAAAMNREDGNNQTKNNTQWGENKESK